MSTNSVQETPQRQCPHCKAMVSRNSGACPACGNLIKWPLYLKIIIAVAPLVVLVLLYATAERTPGHLPKATTSAATLRSSSELAGGKDTCLVKINTDGCRMDRTTPKEIKVWFIYAVSKQALKPKKVVAFSGTVSPPIGQLITIEGPGARVSFSYDNKLAVGVYDSTGAILYSYWMPIADSASAANVIDTALSFAGASSKNTYSVRIEESMSGSKGFQGDMLMLDVVD